MGEGLVRATLAALRTQGPWTIRARSRVWGQEGVTTTLTGDLLVEIYEAIEAGKGPAEELREVHPELAAAPPHPHFPFYMLQDAGCQRLRKAGLIEWDKSARCWRIVGGDHGR